MSRNEQVPVDQMFSVKVNNLPARVDLDAMRSIFQRVGKVGDLFVPRRQVSTSGQRHYAFVRFYHEDDARAAVEKLQGYDFDGWRLELDIAKQPPSRVPYAQARSHPSRDTPPRGGGRHEAREYDYPRRTYEVRDRRMEEGRGRRGEDDERDRRPPPPPPHRDNRDTRPYSPERRRVPPPVEASRGRSPRGSELAARYAERRAVDVPSSGPPLRDTGRDSRYDDLPRRSAADDYAARRGLSADEYAARRAPVSASIPPPRRSSPPAPLSRDRGYERDYEDSRGRERPPPPPASAPVDSRRYRDGGLDRRAPPPPIERRERSPLRAQPPPPSHRNDAVRDYRPPRQREDDRRPPSPRRGAGADPPGRGLRNGEPRADYRQELRRPDSRQVEDRSRSFSRRGGSSERGPPVDRDRNREEPRGRHDAFAPRDRAREERIGSKRPHSPDVVGPREGGRIRRREEEPADGDLRGKRVSRFGGEPEYERVATEDTGAPTVMEVAQDVLPPQDDEDAQGAEVLEAPGSPHDEQEMMTKETALEEEEEEEPNDLEHLLEDVPDITEDAV